MKTASRPDPAVALFSLPCACASLRRATRAVTQAYDDALRPTGIGLAACTLLMTLRRLGPVTQGRLGDVLLLDSTTLSRTLKPLQRAGWIEIVSGRDRRQRMLQVTDRGCDQLAASYPAWSAAQDRLRCALGDSDWVELKRLLTRTSDVVRTLNEGVPLC